MSEKGYEPLDGFYDLRNWDIPKKEFMKLWKIQKFLYNVEMNRRKGVIHPQMSEVRELSGRYQQCLFTYPKSIFSTE